MLIQYAYIKPRWQFGKQCFFEESEFNVKENIPPDPQLTRQYIQRSHCDRGDQMSAQFALHEMQTINKLTSDTGMFHFEGGWSKEINPRDEETTFKFRRRVQRDENWPSKMKTLLDPAEHSVKQNSAIDIYQHYFDDIVPTALVLPRGVRTSNVYADPQPIVRPVSHLSWSSGEHNRLAGAYSFMEFERQPPNVDPCSYIWDIENPNEPVMQLRSSSPLMTIEFNPRDPSMLISGLMSGQVCNWDIRIGNRPVQTSHPQFSHRNPANQALWLVSKTNTEFFSASTSGTIKWWDIRKLREPTEMLVMDLDDPVRADVVHAIGVTSLQFEPTMGYRFMAGMENGVVVNVNRRTTSPTEKLAYRFSCHRGPVIAIDRNPFTPKNFLTVGDCTAKIWADDTREDSLITIREQDADLSGGCWSRARHSVFFTINATGLVEVYDILNGVNEPVAAYRVCDERLTAIAPHEAGDLLAVGAQNGEIYLVECAEGHTVSYKADKVNLNSYFESSSRFEKTVDIRLKEIRLMQVSARDDPAAADDQKQKREKDKKRPRENTHVIHRSEPSRTKFRSKKTKEHSYFANDAELMETQAEYFRTVEREIASYAPFEDEGNERKISQELSRKRKKRTMAKLDEQTAEERDQPKPVKKEKTKKEVIPKLPKSKPLTEESQEVSEEAEVKVAPVVKSKKPRIRKERKDEILTKVCPVEVCLPEICCADMEEQPKAELREQLAAKKGDYSSRDVSPTSPRLGKLADLAEKSPERSVAWRRRLPLQGESLTYVLADEAEEAKRKVRAWQRRVMSGKRDFYLSPRTSEKAYGNPEGEEEAGSGGDGSSAGDAPEGKSDFRRFAETSSRKKSLSEGDGETSSARSKGEAGRLHHAKCAQEGDVHSTLSTYASVYPGDATETTPTTASRRDASSRGGN